MLRGLLGACVRACRMCAIMQDSMAAPSGTSESPPDCLIKKGGPWWDDGPGPRLSSEGEAARVIRSRFKIHTRSRPCGVSLTARGPVTSWRSGTPMRALHGGAWRLLRRRVVAVRPSGCFFGVRGRRQAVVVRTRDDAFVRRQRAEGRGPRTRRTRRSRC
jgi:hypothetical protein